MSGGPGGEARGGRGASRKGAAPAGRQGLGWRILRFPLTRIVVAAVAVVAALLLIQAGLGALPAGVPAWARTVAGMVLTLVTAHLVYRAYVRAVEDRPAREVALQGAAGETLGGALAGAGLMSTVVAVLWIGGLYEVVGTNPWTAVGPALVVSVYSGYVEELLFRCILFRIVEESLGSWIALAVSSILFGAAHVANPNASWVGTVAIALEAGVLISGVYMATRRIWFAAGLHFAWNFTQGGILGIAVSGVELEGLLESRLVGPELLSGGAFGAEASIVAMLVGGVAGVAVVGREVVRDRIVPPFWRRDAARGVPAGGPVRPSPERTPGPDPEGGSTTEDGGGASESTP